MTAARRFISGIIHKYLQYDIYIQNSDWITGGPWYNTYICNKLNGKLYEGFIINAITDR